MNWEYRVIRRKYNDTYGFGIYEVYYKKDKIRLMSSDPVEPVGYSEHPENPSELNDTLFAMVKALNKPILDWDEITSKFELEEE